MVMYRYMARDSSGKRMEGTTHATCEIDVLGWLRERGCTPTSVTEVQSESKAIGRVFHRRRVRSAELSAIFWQLTTMVEGGVTITDALKTVADDVENKRLQTISYQLLDDIERGGYLSTSMAAFPAVFNGLCCALVSTGETCGNLGEALRRVATYFQTRDQLARKIKAAITYPAFVFVFVMLIAFALITFVIPKFIGIFNQMGGKLPTFTRAFMHFYSLLVCVGPFPVVGVAAMLLIFVVCLKTERGHRAFSRIVLRLPLFGDMLKQAFIARFCKTMAILLAGGVPVLEIFNILPEITTNDKLKAAIHQTKKGIIEGSSICSSMDSSGCLPNLMIRMVRAGEESGSLERVLERTAQYYEERVDAMVGTVMALLEPTMIVLVGAVVLVVIIALYLPIFEMSNIRG
jgi:type II secretory pathway component PulF